MRRRPACAIVARCWSPVCRAWVSCWRRPAPWRQVAGRARRAGPTVWRGRRRSGRPSSTTGSPSRPAWRPSTCCSTSGGISAIPIRSCATAAATGSRRAGWCARSGCPTPTSSAWRPRGCPGLLAERRSAQWRRCGLCRSFSALGLSLVVAADLDAAGARCRDRGRPRRRAAQQLRTNTDRRGFDPTLGWVHVTAHTADLLKFLGRHSVAHARAPAPHPRQRECDRGVGADASSSGARTSDCHVPRPRCSVATTRIGRGRSLPRRGEGRRGAASTGISRSPRAAWPRPSTPRPS